MVLPRSVIWFRFLIGRETWTVLDLLVVGEEVARGLPDLGVVLPVAPDEVAVVAHTVTEDVSPRAPDRHVGVAATGGQLVVVGTRRGLVPEHVAAPRVARRAVRGQHGQVDHGRGGLAPHGTRHRPDTNLSVVVASPTPQSAITQHTHVFSGDAPPESPSYDLVKLDVGRNTLDLPWCRTSLRPPPPLAPRPVEKLTVQERITAINGKANLAIAVGAPAPRPPFCQRTRSVASCGNRAVTQPLAGSRHWSGFPAGGEIYDLDFDCTDRQSAIAGTLPEHGRLARSVNLVAQFNIDDHRGLRPFRCCV